jgi:hypothetical protein
MTSRGLDDKYQAGRQLKFKKEYKHYYNLDFFTSVHTFDAW